MSFNIDLKLGNEYEQKFVNFMKMEKYEIMAGVFQAYDIICYDNDETIKYEVKADKLACDTGNICIEFACSNIPSGIKTSESDFYIYYVIGSNNCDLYKIPTQKLKKYIRQMKYDRIVKGGDKYLSRCYLFNKDVFSKYLLQ
jgi:hypothetical protein